ncbi:STM4014 family protein [Streptomyces fuscigenes]|uniref:STM4014 family protein n=1 Tax=Streptomyces fuscigenes TaxID=1528880 RepID=UPI001F45B844|nr:STM4014 family protein [Streptomyces fuscigenes]MCF3964164.1 STM4014 family protein [Streptomyces fuscigenes]
MTLVVVGVPGSRRVALFGAAVAAAGLPPARLVPWADVLRGAPSAFTSDDTVRVDSPGEDAEVDRLLRGGVEPTRVEGTARWYAGVTAAVRRLGRAASDAGAVLLDDPEELAVLFDKRWCHGELARGGVTVPASPTSGPGAPRVRGWEDVRSLMAGAGLRRAFVKIAHGSSASGVLAVETAGGGRVRAITSVERAPSGHLHNSLRVRAYRSERDVAAIVDALAPDGLHVEQWLPKARLRGRNADLRVVVVGGRATHLVVRTGSSPMTNLHLGGARGDLADARQLAATAGGVLDDALRLCEDAAARFPGTHCVGVDLLPLDRGRGFAVCEVNAFGDLLPGLTGLPGTPAEGLDTYGAQLAVRPLRGARAGA